MITKDEVIRKIGLFDRAISIRFTQAQDKLMLDCEATNGEFLYRDAYKILKEFKDNLNLELKELLDAIPIVDTLSIKDSITSIVYAAQELRFANPTDALADKEIQTLVDRIYEDIFTMNTELKII